MSDNPAEQPKELESTTEELQPSPQATVVEEQESDRGIATPAPEEQPKPEVQPQDWRDKRIATLTRRLREMQEQHQRATPTPEPQAQPTPQEWSQQAIEARARELASIQDFNRRCDETALEGRGSYGEAEFNGRIANLQKLVDNSDPASVQAYNSLLMAAIDTGVGSKVLFDLGSDMNEAQRILGLQPTRMAVELTKRAVAPTAQVSNAPRPITPVGGRGVTHERIAPDDPNRADHLSTGEWMRRREAQVAERRRQQ